MTSLLDECLASQKEAGFTSEDRREAICPVCKDKGYNTGLGFWAYECGAEILTDGTVDMPCPLAEDDSDED